MECGEAFGGDPAGFAVNVYSVDAVVAGEALIEDGPAGGLVGVEEGEREQDEREQEVVELVFVAEVGPELGADGVDGGLV